MNIEESENDVKDDRPKKKPSQRAASEDKNRESLEGDRDELCASKSGCDDELGSVK
jgi:hypothetical protein